MWPLGGANFWLQVHNLNKLCRGPLGDASNIKALVFAVLDKILSSCFPYIYLKPKVTLHCYYIYLFWVLVSGILNVFNSY